MQIGSEVKSGYRPHPKINKILDPNPDLTGSGPGSGKTRSFLGSGPEKKIKLWTRTREKDKILDPDPDPTGFGSGSGRTRSSLIASTLHQVVKKCFDYNFLL